jgi:hypothetical protein
MTITSEVDPKFGRRMYICIQQLACIYYTIEWKETVNGKQVAKQMETNLVQAPHAFRRPFCTGEEMNSRTRPFEPTIGPP